jgi:hypothetical protein
MTRRYTRAASHAPAGYVLTTTLAAEIGQRAERVRKLARRHGLLVEVMGDQFIDRDRFLELLKPRVVPAAKPASSTDTDRAA